MRAGLVGEVGELDGYPWTGHSRLMGRIVDGWQEVDLVLAQFGRRVAEEHGLKAEELLRERAARAA